MTITHNYITAFAFAGWMLEHLLFTNGTSYAWWGVALLFLALVFLARAVKLERDMIRRES